jgi:Domain of unknown function (DUF4396)
MTTLWKGSAISATHCGAGCTLGDVIGEWAIFAGGVTIAIITYRESRTGK